MTSPTYNGIATDIREIVRVAHQYKKILLVDEAHGPHLKFHPDLPLSAMEGGADMCVQSTHKIISGMTQASMMHARKTVDILKLKRILQLLHTTSPSYILMASLDVARMQMATEGRAILSKVITLANLARAEIVQAGLGCFGKEAIGREGIYDVDVTKLTIDTRAAGNSGYEVAKILNKKYGVQIEFAAPTNVLAIMSLGNTKEDINRLVKALKEIKKTFTPNEELIKKINSVKAPELESEVVLTPREAAFSVTKKIPFKEAIGMVSAELICPYPPGIPVLAPGERITKEVYEYLMYLRDLGNMINGQDDKTLQTVKVVAEARPENGHGLFEADKKTPEPKKN